jgi:hypothetical protein
LEKRTLIWKEVFGYFLLFMAKIPGLVTLALLKFVEMQVGGQNLLHNLFPK